MIDIDKIEAAAKSATPGPWKVSDIGVGFEVDDSAGEIVAQAQQRPEGGRLSPAIRKANATHIATANPSTVLEIVSMIRERDAVLKQALVAFGEVAQWESEGDPSHPASKAIAAIKEVLGGSV